MAGADQPPHVTPVEPGRDLDHAGAFGGHDHLEIEHAVTMPQCGNDRVNQLQRLLPRRHWHMHRRDQVAARHAGSRGAMHQPLRQHADAGLAATNQHVAGNLDAVEEALDNGLPAARQRDGALYRLGKILRAVDALHATLALGVGGLHHAGEMRPIRKTLGIRDLAERHRA